MGAKHDYIPDKILEWLKKQKIFFVATAPLMDSGHVNVSPKGYQSISFISRNQVAYADLTGSGIETVSHLKENGRITLMFCSFDAGLPRIVRLYGKGRVVERGQTAPFAGWLAKIQPDINMADVQSAIRAVIVVDIYHVAEACGFCVPIMDYKEDRCKYINYCQKKTDPDWSEKYVEEKNAKSLDGLEGITKGGLWPSFKRAGVRVGRWVLDWRTLTGLVVGMGVALVLESEGARPRRDKD